MFRWWISWRLQEFIKMYFSEKIIKFIKEDLNRMSTYERWRLVFQIIQIIITLGVPFIAVWLNKNWH
jgi:hypothetical protein